MSELIFNEVPTAFPWYDKLHKQDRFRQNVLKGCYFELLSPSNSLLPFQYRRVKSPEPPIKWEIMDLAGLNMIDISNNLAFVKGKSLEGYDYIYYGGDELEFLRDTTPTTVTPEPLNLPSGYYYSTITFESSFMYSEVFFVPGRPFKINDLDGCPFLRLEWYNKNDIPPFYYNDQVSGIPVFKNLLFIDTFTTNSEIEIQQEGDKDGQGVLIPDFQHATMKYRITVLVPDFLKVGLVLMQMHGNVFLRERKNVRAGQLLRIATNVTLEANGALSQVDIIYEQDLAINKLACNNAMVSDGVGGGAPILNNLYNTTGHLTFVGSAPADAWVFIYGSTTSGGTYSKISGPYKSSDFASGITVELPAVGSNQYFYVEALNFNFNYGHTTPIVKP